jgi:hypothetical protein
MSASRQLYRNILALLIIIIPLLSKATDPLDQFGINKEIPAQFRKPILTALSYFPELKDVHIIFRIKKQFTPLTTKPDLGSVLKRKNHRTYIITISNQTVDTLEHLLFQNLSFDEQVGVMGHELSHVVDFNSKNFPQSVGVGFGHLSKKYLDKMEYNTDRICIQHGLGKYLLAYSEHVRATMHVHTWRGVDFVMHNDQKHERYMNPDTIEKFIDKMNTH